MFSKFLLVALLASSILLSMSSASEQDFLASGHLNTCEKKVAAVARFLCDKEECVAGFEERVENACKEALSFDEIERLCCYA